MSKFNLEFEEEYPFYVVGITSSIKDYKLCWHLNKELGLNLVRHTSLELFNKRRDSVSHEFFLYEDEDAQVNYRLIENRKGGNLFLTEAPQADFLMILDESPVLDCENLIKRIKSIRSVLMAFRIDLDKVKNKQNILLTA